MMPSARIHVPRLLDARSGQARPIIYHPAVWWIRDILYFVVALLTSPIWLVRMIRTGKIRTDWRARFGYVPTHAHRPIACPGETRPPRILLHAVSVGEANAIRTLVEALATDGYEVVITTTTDTGFARATTLYGEAHTVARYPFDFSRCVRRFLDAVEPDLVALVELEVWPTFVSACARREIPVVVINGRLSEGSFRGYRRISKIVRPTFARLSGVAAQDDAIAARFVALGVDASRVEVLGTLKWDTASLIKTDQSEALSLASEMGIDPTRPLVVAGSTAPGEEALINDAVPSDVQLLVAPRKPERFDEAAAALAPCRRRSEGIMETNEQTTNRFLLDTIGELRLAYALADVVVVGRTLVPGFGGSDMIEPIALERATIVGPHVENFAIVASALQAGGGLLQVEPGALGATIAGLLSDEPRRARLGACGGSIIEAHRGVTAAVCMFLTGFLAGSLRVRHPDDV